MRGGSVGGQTFEFLFVSVFQKPDELKRICMLALAMDHSPLRQLPVQLKRDIVNVLKGFNMKQLLDNFLLEPFNDLFPGPCESTQVKWVLIPLLAIEQPHTYG